MFVFSRVVLLLGAAGRDAQRREMVGNIAVLPLSQPLLAPSHTETSVTSTISHSSPSVSILTPLHTGYLTNVASLAVHLYLYLHLENKELEQKGQKLNKVESKMQ